MSEKRTVLITGSGRGIGAATARALGQRGFHVVVNYRSDRESAQQVVADIEAGGGIASLAQADVTDAREAEDLIAGLGGLDALVCNANIQPTFDPLPQLGWDMFAASVTAELAAAFHVTKAALRLMRRGSHIVYVSSVAADSFSEGGAVLSTKKAALEAFARQVATEAAPDGVAVNIVAPGAVRTDASAAVLTAELMTERSHRSVLGRILEPTDVGALIAALVAGELLGVAGIRIPIDGGYGILAS